MTVRINLGKERFNKIFSAFHDLIKSQQIVEDKAQESNDGTTWIMVYVDKKTKVNRYFRYITETEDKIYQCELGVSFVRKKQ